MNNSVLLAAAMVLCCPAAPASHQAQSAKTFTPKAAEWNHWRGPRRDGRSPDTGLLKEWPAGGPKLAWKATGLGEGYSSVSFSGNRIFTMGDLAEGCCILALDLASGKRLWAAPVGKTGGGGGYPGPRCTPATDGKLVVALGQYGDLVCAEAATGRVLWKKNLQSDFGGRMMSGWGYSESPLIDGDLVICTPGGPQGTIMALNKSTGAPAWRCKEVTDNAAYCSVVPLELGGVRQYVQFTDASVFGVTAGTGKLLWRAERPGKTAVVPDPIYFEGIVLVTSGYGIGCNGFRVTPAGGKFEAKEIYANKDLEVHHGGVVLAGQHAYGLTNRNQLVCMDIRTGQVAWRDRSVGKGSITYADGHLICRSERGRGTVALVEATPSGYREKGRFDQPDRSDRNSWPHPVVFGGRLYIRDQDVLLCYNVKAN